MGFRVKSFVVTAGSSDFPTGNTDELRRSRSEFLLTKLAQALIACNCGWQLDTSKSATDTSYTDIPCRTGSKTYPGLFFINTISGCKLFMAYFGDEIQYNGIKNFSGSDLVLYYNSDYHGGVCCSIIPAGSSSTFGAPTTTTFIPADATRICGTFYRNNFSFSSINYAAAYNPIYTYYRYWIYATPYTIGLYVNHDNSYSKSIPSNLIYVTGRIFSTLFHEDDNAINSKYGTYMIRDMSGDDEGWAVVICSNQTVFSKTVYFPGRENNPSNGRVGIFPSASISRADGTWILGGDNSVYNTVARCEDIMHLSQYVFSLTSDGKTRWIPISILYTASNLETSGIVAGDGAKGILDTDLFRCAVASYENRFDNGNFICMESDKGMIYGVDPRDDPFDDVMS